MLRTISEKLRTYGNGWLVLLFLCGVLLFNLVILPGQQAQLRVASGGTDPIDAQLFYTPEKAYSMVASYGEAGRAAYRTFELTGDILYPVMYTRLFSLLITWFFSKGFAANSAMQKLNIVPLGGWLFDLCENLSIATMLSLYPSTPTRLAWMGSIFTLLKWLFIAASSALVATGFLAALKNRFRKQEGQPTNL
jgi:hypothetical protein